MNKQYAIIATATFGLIMSFVAFAAFANSLSLSRRVTELEQQTRSADIVARSLTIVDGNGNRWISLEASDSHATFFMQGGNKPRFGVVVNEAGSTMQLSAGDRHYERVVLSADTGASGEIYASDGRERTWSAPQKPTLPYMTD